jgi:hypothetical protein
MMGASKLLVRCTVRMRPLFLSPSPEEEMAIWFEGGGVPLARFINAPEDGEPARFDILEEEVEGKRSANPNLNEKSALRRS